MGGCGFDMVGEISVEGRRISGSSVSPVPPESDPHWEESFPHRIQGENSAGAKVSGRLLQFSYRSASAIFSGDGSELARGDRLSDIRISWGGKFISVEQGRVDQVREHSAGAAMEIVLPGEWVSGEKCGELHGGQKEGGLSVPSRDFAVAVDGLETLLQSLYEQLGPSQERLPEGTAGADGDSAFQETWSREVFPALSDAIQTFEWAAEQAVECGEERVFKEYCHRKLYPLVLCSPFISRVVERPVGVPGDFGMLGKILGDPFEGQSLISSMVNGWILTTTAAEAYRHRVALLTREIGALEKSEDHDTRVMSLGCGVAYEIQAAMTDGGTDFPLSFELVDFNEATLEEASQSLLEIQNLHKLSHIQFEFVKKSVKELIRSAAPSGRGEFALAYCTGLFDYLPDKVCVRVIRYLFGAIAPGGRAIVSNFTPFNPIKHFMEFVLDWKLIHRTADDLHRLIQEAALGECATFQIVNDPGKVECYGIIDKLRNP